MNKKKKKKKKKKDKTKEAKGIRAMTTPTAIATNARPKSPKLCLSVPEPSRISEAGIVLVVRKRGVQSRRTTHPENLRCRTIADACKHETAEFQKVTARDYLPFWERRS